MMKKCVACYQKEIPSSNSTFHRFLTDKNLQQTWLKLLNRLDLNNISYQRVWSSHLASSSLIAYTSTQTHKVTSKKGLKRLKCDTLPLIIATSVQKIAVMTSISTQTHLELNDLSDLFDKISFFRSYDTFKMIYELLQACFMRLFQLFFG